MSKNVVVTGIGIISPLGLDASSTWDSLIEGKSGVDYIGSFDTEQFETHIAAEVKNFNPEDFLDKKEARRMDRFVQFAAVATQEALLNAKIELSNENPERVSVMIGSGIGGILTLSKEMEVLLQRGPSRVNPFLIPMMLGDMASGRVSMLVGAKGPNFSSISSCATGADTIAEASALIRKGEIDIAITGGAEAPICPIGIAGFNACHALSKNNSNPIAASRPFDANRDGFVIGEGASVLILESLEHAIERGAEPLAELAGHGATADAHHITQPAPGGEGGARAITKALNHANVSKNDVSYINAHGTSTPLNDKYETMAIKSVFGEQSKNISISSTKSMTGHLLGAGGALEASISVLSIKNNVIPPTINLENPDPDCDLDYTPNKPTRKQVNVVISNSLGFGGHNTCLVFKKFI
ncbi:MAG: beta-ketoacyl-ACP synthase II [SAR202 cluster bacterium]|nr:beta-ketoacyl-ACP synthase II [SAR202 cluster bacterium]